MTTFQMPSVSVGDLVLWHSDPAGSEEGVLGWVVEKPGRESISILVFTQSGGFAERKSVRHKDDPFWRESEAAPNWMQWGAWREHETTALLKELKAHLTRMKVDAARAVPASVDAPVKRGPGRPRKEEVHVLGKEVEVEA